MKKLHFGCGQNKFDGWVNSDILSSADVHHDVTRRWPFPDNEFDLVYSEHVLEHFDLKTGRHILSEAFRVLIPGGTLRIAMPDLDYVVKMYKSKDWKNQDWIQNYGYKDIILTPCEMLNTALRDWGHTFVYDADQLFIEFARVGFYKTIQHENGKSKIQELKNLETRVDSRLVVEGVKP